MNRPTSRPAKAAADPVVTGSDQRLRLIVGVLVALEAAGLAAGAVGAVVAVLVSDQEDPAALLSLAALGFVVGVGLGFCARGVFAGARWSRGPVFTWQLLQAGVAMPLSASGAWFFGVPLLAVAVVVGVLVAGRHVIAREEVD